MNILNPYDLLRKITFFLFFFLIFINTYELSKSQDSYYYVNLNYNEDFDKFNRGTQGFIEYFSSTPVTFWPLPQVPFNVALESEPGHHVLSTLFEWPENLYIYTGNTRVEEIYILGTGTWLAGSQGHDSLWCDDTSHFSFSLFYNDSTIVEMFPTMVSNGLNRWGDILYGPYSNYDSVASGSFLASPIGYFHIYKIPADSSKGLLKIVLNDKTDVNNFGDYTVMAVTLKVTSHIWFVKADGSGDVPNIQSAIDSAINLDTILVAPGIYTGDGNRDIIINGFYGERPTIFIISQDGPENTIIDCQGTSADWHFAFDINDYYGRPDVTIDGFSFTGIYAAEGVINCDFSFCKINSSIFFNNFTLLTGAINCYNSPMTIQGCTFINNSTYGFGSGITINNHEYNDSLFINNCVFNGNSSDSETIYINFSSPLEISCTNIFENVGGDWVGSIANQNGVNGNISVDPLFCDTANGIFLIDSTSPCAPDNNSCGELIGALGVGCSTTCCSGIRGNIDGVNDINIADLVYFVDYSFSQPPGPEPPCMDEADVNGDASVDIGDIVYLVDYMFEQPPGPAPVECL